MVIVRSAEGGPVRRIVALVRAFRAVTAGGHRLPPGSAAYVEIDVPAILLLPCVARWALSRAGAPDAQLIWPRGGFAAPDLLLPIDDRRATHHYLHRELYAVGGVRRAARAVLLVLRHLRLLTLVLPRYALVARAAA
jgi:hypothetical protein